MRVGFLIVFLFTFVGCNSERLKKSNEELKSINEEILSINTNFNPTLFKNLRSAIYHKDTSNINLIFEFPLRTKNNSLGYVIDNENWDKIEIVDKRTFYLNYDKIFPNDFIKGLLKIKSDSLVIGHFEGTKLPMKSFRDSFAVSGQIDTISKNLIIYYQLFFFSEEDGIIGESTISYKFRYNQDKLKFEEIQMAG